MEAAVKASLCTPRMRVNPERPGRRRAKGKGTWEGVRWSKALNKNNNGGDKMSCSGQLLRVRVPSARQKERKKRGGKSGEKLITRGKKALSGVGPLSLHLPKDSGMLLPAHDPDFFHFEIGERKRGSARPKTPSGQRRRRTGHSRNRNCGIQRSSPYLEGGKGRSGGAAVGGTLTRAAF